MCHRKRVCKRDHQRKRKSSRMFDFFKPKSTRNRPCGVQTMKFCWNPVLSLRKIGGSAYDVGKSSFVFLIQAMYHLKRLRKRKHHWKGKARRISDFFKPKSTKISQVLRKVQFSSKKHKKNYIPTSKCCKFQIRHRIDLKLWWDDLWMP